MSNEPETIDDMDLTIGLTFYNGGTAKLQQVVHGMDPVILIKPTFDDGADIPGRIDIQATGPSSAEELAEFFFALAGLIRDSEVTSSTLTTNNDTGQED